MKKTITFLTMSFIGLCLSAQNYGVNLDYMMLSGTMVKDSNGDAVTYGSDTTEVAASTIVLGVYYTYDISEKMNVSASEIEKATEAFLTSSTRDISPISNLGDIELADVPGETTLEVSDKFSELVASNPDP